jgi:hypothetical protein
MLKTPPTAPFFSNWTRIHQNCRDSSEPRASAGRPNRRLALMGRNDGIQGGRWQAGQVLVVRPTWNAMFVFQFLAGEIPHCGRQFSLDGPLAGCPRGLREGGLEPPRLAAPDPKSGASANSATLAKSRAQEGATPFYRAATQSIGKWPDTSRPSGRCLQPCCRTTKICLSSRMLNSCGSCPTAGVLPAVLIGRSPIAALPPKTRVSGYVQSAPLRLYGLGGLGCLWPVVGAEFRIVLDGDSDHRV